MNSYRIRFPGYILVGIVCSYQGSNNIICSKGYIICKLEVLWSGCSLKGKLIYTGRWIRGKVICKICIMLGSNKLSKMLSMAGILYMHLSMFRMGIILHIG